MIKLDDNLLDELGLGALPKEEKAAFLRHMYETLEMRVGTRLAERMSEQQMVEFEQFINTGDEQGAFKWLEANFPDYKQVVAEEFEKLKAEVRPVAAQIVAASQQQAQMQPGVPTTVPGAAPQHAAVVPQYPPVSQPMPQAAQQPDLYGGAAQQGYPVPQPAPAMPPTSPAAPVAPPTNPVAPMSPPQQYGTQQQHDLAA